MQILCHLVHGTERLWRLVSTGSWPVLRKLPQVSCPLWSPHSKGERERGRERGRGGEGERTKQLTARWPLNADTDCPVAPAVLLTGSSPFIEPLPTASPQVLNHRSERKYPARGLQAPGYYCINQSIYNFFFCIVLFKDILFNIYCRFINFELMANSTITGT